jgi:phosphate uptake regulator
LLAFPDRYGYRIHVLVGTCGTNIFEADDSFRAVVRERLSYMIEDPHTIFATQDIIFIAKALE